MRERLVSTKVISGSLNVERAHPGEFVWQSDSGISAHICGGQQGAVLWMWTGAFSSLSGSVVQSLGACLDSQDCMASQ